MNWPMLIIGILIGLCFGLELARRAYRDTAGHLDRSSQLLAEQRRVLAEHFAMIRKAKEG
jgi:uncharacterized membrane-anchored protein YhcB (DUF1043 family)